MVARTSAGQQTGTTGMEIGATCKAISSTRGLGTSSLASIERMECA